MAMKRCEKGHYWNPEEHSSCPFCGTVDLPTGTIDKNKIDENTSGWPPPNQGSEDPTQVRGQNPAATPTPGKEGETIKIGIKEKGFDPVVGWLVCVEGPAKGRDYRIRSELNFIGRSEGSHICIKGDETISREKHAKISFNARKNSFALLQGESTGLVYLNDDPVYSPADLKLNDIIEMGQTKLMFVPLCGEHFQWEDQA